MGNLLTPRKKSLSAVMLGLDAAGKTTIIYAMSTEEIITTIPTIGFNVENTKISGADMVVWDVGGEDKIRPLWRHYFQGRNAIICPG